MNTARSSKLHLWLILVAFIVLCATQIIISWQKWPDILVDFGREVYVPWRISDGEILYRDIAHFNGPLSVYFNAMIFHFLGAHILHLAIINILLLLILAYMIYKIFTFLQNQMIGNATAASFLCIFAFSQYGSIGNYNYVCPYSHELTHGIFLSFLGLTVFFRFCRQSCVVYIFILGLITGFIFLTKIEVFLAWGIAVASGLVLFSFFEKYSFKSGLKVLSLFLFGFLLPSMAFVIYLCSYFTPLNALTAILIPYRIAFDTPIVFSNFYRNLAGLNTPIHNLFLTCVHALWYPAGIVFFNFSFRFIDRLNLRAARIISTLLTVSGITAACFFTLYYPGFSNIYRGLPVLLLFAGCYQFYLLIKAHKDLEKRSINLSFLTFIIFGFFLLLKIILDVNLYNYGFVLAMPASLIIISFLFSGLSVHSSQPLALRILPFIILASVMASHIWLYKIKYDAKDFPIGQGPDKILTTNQQTMSVVNRGLQTQKTLDEINKNMYPSSTFTVFPEGVLLNFLSKKLNPIPYLNFMPPEIAFYGENNIIESLNKNMPDYILLIDRNVLEYGFQEFGKDYGRNIYLWIQDNYDFKTVIGAIDNKSEFTVRILIKKSHSSE